MNRLPVAVRLFATATLAAAGPSAVAQDAGCGTLDVITNAVNSEDLYRVRILEVDGKLPLAGKTLFKLPVGKHTVKVGNLIPPRELSYSVARWSDKRIHNRTLDIEVQKDVSYLLAAKLLREHEDEPKAFWEPVVIRGGNAPCTMK